MIKNNKRVSNKNSTNKVIALLLGILGISLVIALVAITVVQKNSSSYFIQDTAISTEKIYNNLLDLTEDNYPQSPEEVVNLYTESYKLVYGNRIKTEYIDTVLPTILEKQRLLFSEQLINDNPIESQITSVKEIIDFLSKNKLKIISIETLPVIYDHENPNIAHVNVKIQDNSIKEKNETSFTTYYYKYYLELGINGKWHITGFYPTNEKFNLIN